MPTVVLINLVYNYNGNKRGLPIGALSLVAGLQEAQVDVQFLDYQLVPIGAALDLDWLLDHIPRGSVLAISCMYTLLPLAVILAERAHHEKHCLVIMGGIGPGGVAEELTNAFPFIRLVVSGAGEHTLIQVAQGHVPEARVLCPPQESLLFRQALPLTQQAITGYNVIGLVGTLGCHYECAFCDIPAQWGHVVKYRAIDLLLDEVRVLVDTFGVRDVYLYDDTFVTHYNRVAAICDFARSRSDFRWKCFGRLNQMSGDMLAEMGHSGCDRLFFGIESGSQRVLDRIGKQIDLVEATSIIQEALSNILQVRAQFIVGFPFETIEDFQRTVELMDHLSDQGADVGADILVPLPGSKLYREYFHILRFAEEICDVWLDKILQDSDVYTMSGKQRTMKQQMKTMIASHPQIFAPFYVFAHPELTHKLQILSRSRSAASHH